MQDVRTRPGPAYALPGEYTSPEDLRLPRFPTVRRLTLLAILITVGLVSLHQSLYTRAWVRPLAITIFPLNGDDDARTAAYIDRLRRDDFVEIEAWAAREARRHDLDLERPMRVRLGEPIAVLPPAWPGDEATPIDVLLWGLRFRWWAYRHTPDDAEPLTRVRLYLVLHSDDGELELPHSLGMQKGLIGLVHGFAEAEQASQNRIVVAHEILHTVGAVDKYDANGLPLYPLGYANPARQPLYPQRSAEVMAGRIPLSRSRAYMAESLRSVIISPLTAAEIGWRDW